MTRKRYLDALVAAFPDCIRRRTCLYIGAHPAASGAGRAFWNEIRAAGYRMTVVEAFPENCAALESELFDGEEIICADIQEWDTPEKFDLVMWWHGPEHVSESAVVPMLEKLKTWSRHRVVIGAPWGKCPQGEAYGNSYEEHLSEINEGVLGKAGYTCQTFGKRNRIENGQIVGWWIREG